MGRRFVPVVVIALSFLIAVNASAQSVLDRAKDAAKRKAEEKLSRPAEPADAEEAEQSEPEAEAEDSQETEPAPPPQKKASRPGEGAWANFDFVPGETVLFADDFSKDRVGNFPQRFELLNGTAEIVEWEGSRWLRSAGESVQFVVNLPQNLPERFTMEFDVSIPWWGMGFTTEVPGEIPSDFQLPHGSDDTFEKDYFVVSGTEVGLYRGGQKGKSLVDPKGLFPELQEDYDTSEASRPFRVRVHADGKYVKMYLNERRVVNMPNANLARGKQVLFVLNSGNADRGLPMIGNVTINAGGRDMYDALNADGRVATQGIYFDTGSDRIRPESGGTLKQIADMLTSHSDLRLTIEGHTDNVGDAAANQKLSEKRASAVKQALVSRYRIDASRLETKGLGATKPRGKNDTAEGRQNNRRVELVKL